MRASNTMTFGMAKIEQKYSKMTVFESFLAISRGLSMKMRLNYTNSEFSLI